MKEFIFSQEQLVKVWRKAKFVVKANSLEEAKSFIEKHKSEDIESLCYMGDYKDKLSIIDADYIYDTETKMDKKENNGVSTNDIFDNNYNLIFTE